MPAVFAADGAELAAACEFVWLSCVVLGGIRPNVADLRPTYVGWAWVGAGILLVAGGGVGLESPTYGGAAEVPPLAPVADVSGESDVRSTDVDGCAVGDDEPAFDGLIG